MDIFPYQFHRNQTLFRIRGINAKSDDMLHSSDQDSMKYVATEKMEDQASDSRFRLCEGIIVYLGIHRMKMNVTMITGLEVHRAPR